MENLQKIVSELELKSSQVKAVLDLTAEGNTIPFIARYRKEMTDSLDEVQIKAIIDLDLSLTRLSERREVILSKIKEAGKLTDSLHEQIFAAEKLTELEELYLPFKEKRRTKATIARENGLYDLSQLIVKNSANLEQEAEKFINENFPGSEKALSGAIDILSEMISESVNMRAWLLTEIKRNSQLISSLKAEAADEKQTFQIYYDFSEKIDSIPNHRVLALNRGEKLGILSVKFEHDEDKMLRFFESRLSAQNNKYMKLAIKEALKKKLIPILERKVRTDLTERAEEAAISVFSDNLKHLLLVAPLKGYTVLGFDPGFRNGCKLAVVDKTGKYLASAVIYPTKPASNVQIEKAKIELVQLIQDYNVEMIAIGNGTASRESEAFVAEIIRENSFNSVHYVIVSEAGASVYSASEVARDEFPDLSIEKRSAVSIARRLQDPLAELVKIDPQAIGVGQYQHDVSEKKLSESLDFVVETVVNQVGVNVNTASPSLLSHVSGLNKSLAQNLVTYREENGLIKTRTELKKVPRLGAKAFEQAAGFLRIPESQNFLDNTGVHPESYIIAKQLLEENSLESLASLTETEFKKLASKLSIGEITLKDIIYDLLKPGRDLRENFDTPVLRQDILKISDLTIGQELEGVVRNVVDFGAFIDIGLHDDGLAHISDLAKKFIKHPSEVLAVGEIVTVWVTKIDLQRGKIGLTLLNPREK